MGITMGTGRPFLDVFDVDDLESQQYFDLEHTPYPLSESLEQVLTPDGLKSVESLI